MKIDAFAIVLIDSGNICQFGDEKRLSIYLDEVSAKLALGDDDFESYPIVKCQINYERPK